MPHTLASLLFAALALTRTDAADTRTAQSVELRVEGGLGVVFEDGGLNCSDSYSSPNGLRIRLPRDACQCHEQAPMDSDPMGALFWR